MSSLGQPRKGTGQGCNAGYFEYMHNAITKAFKRYNLFGFTGTPIFASNSGSGGNPSSGRSARSPSGSHDTVDTVTANPASTGACVPTWVAD